MEMTKKERQQQEDSHNLPAELVVRVKIKKAFRDYNESTRRFFSQSAIH